MLYGKVIVRTARDGMLGIVISGDSLGEESLFKSNYVSRHLNCVISCRRETCVAECKASLLEFEKAKLDELKKQLIDAGLKADFMLLFSVFRKCYDKKNAWHKTQPPHS